MWSVALLVGRISLKNLSVILMLYLKLLGISKHKYIWDKLALKRGGLYCEPVGTKNFKLLKEMSRLTLVFVTILQQIRAWHNDAESGHCEGFLCPTV